MTTTIQTTGTRTATIQTVPTPDGPFTIVTDEDDRVLASGWTDDPRAVLDRISTGLRPAEVRDGETRAADAVNSYYAGDVAAIDSVEVVQDGTPGQREGWAALRRIPAGHPLSYAGFAELLGRPTAVRAVASVCATNAPALFVPCHRVLRSDGSLGGFAWGVDVKRRLLDREAAAV